MKKENKEKQKKVSSCFVKGGAAIAGAGMASYTAEKTEYFNSESDNIRFALRQENRQHEFDLLEKLKSEPDYVGDRQKAVSMTWKYEEADVKMGGNGSANLNATEKAELLNTHKVRGCEVHHINSVAEHPKLQTSADNGIIYRSKKEHLLKGHNGDFKHPSCGPLIDRDEMLRNTNTRRVIKNELKGAGAAVAVGAGVEVCHSVVANCMQEGVSVKSVKKGLKKSVKPAALTGAITLLAYGANRLVSHLLK